MTRPCLSAKEAVAQVLDPAGKIVIDVGCGDGAMVRHFARLGADAYGIETDDAQLARARAKRAEGGAYRVGRAECLPFGDEFADAILYLNSLHHVAPPAMGPALHEAARVLKSGGTLIVIEPLAEGRYFEAMLPIEDETEVRRAAADALSRVPSSLTLVGSLIYESAIRFLDADHFLQAIVAPDKERARRLPYVEAELRRRFAALAEPDGDGFFFVSPLSRSVFRKS